MKNLGHTYNLKNHLLFIWSSDFIGHPVTYLAILPEVLLFLDEVEKDEKQRKCPTQCGCASYFPRKWCHQTTVYCARRFCGSGIGQGIVGMCGVSAERQRLARLKAHLYTCLLVDAGCWLAFRLRPPAGDCTCGLSVWPEILANMMAEFQGWRENEKRQRQRERFCHSNLLIPGNLIHSTRKL